MKKLLYLHDSPYNAVEFCGVKLRKLVCVEGNILFSHCKEFLSAENDDVGCL